MVSNWARQDFPALAPAVRVPVQFSIAEHEKVWQSDPPAQAEIASMFSGAPRFQINEQARAGHNISLGHTAARLPLDGSLVRRRMRERSNAEQANRFGGRLMRVGFIGLGSQGGPMAGRIVEAGFPTTLWARRPAVTGTVRRHRRQGRRIAGRTRRRQRSRLPVRGG